MVTLLSRKVGIVSTVGVRRVRDIGRRMRRVANVRIGRQMPSDILRRTSRIIGVSLATRRLVTHLGTKGVCHPRGVRATLSGFFQARGVLRLHRLTLGRMTLEIRGGIRGRIMVKITIKLERRGFVTYVDDRRGAPQEVVEGTTGLTAQCGAAFVTLCIRAPGRDVSEVNLTERHCLLGRFGLIARLKKRIIRMRSESVLKDVIRVYGRGRVSAMYVNDPSLGLPCTVYSVLKCQGFLGGLSQTGMSLVVLTWCWSCRHCRCWGRASS